MSLVSVWGKFNVKCQCSCCAWYGIKSSTVAAEEVRELMSSCERDCGLLTFVSFQLSIETRGKKYALELQKIVERPTT